MATPIPNNECELTLEEAARAVGGRLLGSNRTLRGVFTDSRALRPGGLFVALNGNRDGHQFVGPAAAAGAAGAIVERGRHVESLPSIEVADTLAALGALARYHLERIQAARRRPVIAICGSAGKTTAKEISVALAAALFGEILATPGNLNNLIGVPMTLLMLREEHRALIIECGTNAPGEISRLGAILSPDVALVLNVDIEHSEGLGGLREIAQEETSIFRWTKGFAVAPAGEALVLERIPMPLQVITFGESTEADVRVARKQVGPSGHANAVIELGPALAGPGKRRQLDARLKLLGTHVATNVAAALAAVGAAWGSPLSDNRLTAIQEALATVEPLAGRLAACVIGGIFIIDDTYNSNPRSLQAALTVAREVATARKARLLLALGDMLELGPLSAAMHDDAVARALAMEPAALVAVGSEISNACRRAHSAGAPSVITAATSEEAAGEVSRLARVGDVLLIKGSRGIAMERIIEELRGDRT